MNFLGLYTCLVLCTIEQVISIDETLKNKLITDHNEFRRFIALGKGGQVTASNIREMSWDTDLENKAQIQANKCTKNHDTYADRRTTKFYMVGQNICLSSDVTECTKLWFDERSSFTFPMTCTSNCGHYTQVIWASTYKIGCGYAVCTGFNSLVCNYGPAGNEQGTDPYVEGYPGADCPPGTTKNNGLCCMIWFSQISV